jgi:hypothetical protein
MKIAPSSFLLVLVLSSPSVALDIQIIAGPGLAGNVPALAAWQRAAVQWESRFSDPIIVKIDADMAALGPGIIGSAGSELLFGDTYEEIRDLIVADAADEPLNAIVSSLPATIAGLNVNLSAGRSLENSLIVTKANLKALNPNTTGWSVSLLDYVFNDPDAAITFSNSFNFDYDNSGLGICCYTYQT